VEKAVLLLGSEGKALDLGCGAGRDTRYLLSQGWHVTAVDKESEAIELLAGLPQEKLVAIQSSIEDFDYTLDRYDLISAQYSLPFVPKSHLVDAFTSIKKALRPGGIFTGQFFGTHDEWNIPGNNLSFVTREEVDELLIGLDALEITEEDKVGTMATGGTKHWHVFHVLAQKK
jgi:SAM-dependent methyltransferase